MACFFLSLCHLKRAMQSQRVSCAVLNTLCAPYKKASTELSSADAFLVV